MTEKSEKSKKPKKSKSSIVSDIDYHTKEPLFFEEMIMRTVNRVNLVEKYNKSGSLDWYYMGFDVINCKINGILVSDLRTINTENDEEKYKKSLDMIRILKILEKLDELEEGINENCKKSSK